MMLMPLKFEGVHIKPPRLMRTLADSTAPP